MNVLIEVCCKCGAELNEKRFALQTYFAESPGAMGAMDAHGYPAMFCTTCFRSLNDLVNAWIDGRLRAATPPAPHFGRIMEAATR